MTEIHPTLQKVILLLPMFQELFPFDSMPAVSDLDKFIAYRPGKNIKMADFTGRLLDATSDHYQAIRQRKIIYNIVSKDIFGFAFKGITAPVYDENDKNTIVGALGFGYSVDTEFALKEMAQSLSASAEELSALAESFAANATSLKEKTNTLSNSSRNMFQNLEKTEDMLRFVDDLADKTRLLGLNAAIQAARAGEHGRAFSVVAEEIQKMSGNSTTSVNLIKEHLKNIQNEVDMVNKLITDTRELSSQQSSASMEISNSISSIAKITETLNEISSKL